MPTCVRVAPRRDAFGSCACARTNGSDGKRALRRRVGWADGWGVSEREGEKERDKESRVDNGGVAGRGGDGRKQPVSDGGEGAAAAAKNNSVRAWATLPSVSQWRRSSARRFGAQVFHLSDFSVPPLARLHNTAAVRTGFTADTVSLPLRAAAAAVRAIRPAAGGVVTSVRT